jgi:large repetitive protein
VANAQALQLHLTGLTSEASQNATYDLPFNVLEGDVTGDHVVDQADANAITTLIANNNNNPITTITSANAQFDLNLDGVVNAADATKATSLAGQSLPVQTDANVALFKHTSPSSSNGGNIAANAVDNNLTTRWESQQGVDPQSLVIDLNNAANIHTIVLDWENAAGANYVLQTSNDPTVIPEAATPDCSTANTKWTTVVNVTGNTNGGIKTYSGLNGNGRFVRMCGTTRTTTFGYSLFDFEVIGSFGAATPTPPVITSAPTATATEGQSFGYTITSNEAGTTFSTSSLPTGLGGTGAVISGTPTVTGSFPITLTATNSTGQSGTATLTLTINAPAPVITSATTVTTTEGQPFSYTITSNEAGTTFSTSPLPTGLGITGAVISGTPTVTGSFPITLTATNSTGQTGSATLSLTISNAAPVIPVAPTNLTPTAVSSSQINLSWTASTTQGVTYSVFRSTTSGFTPTASNQIAQNLTTTADSDTGLTASTTYFYVVEAVNGAGSAQSLQASTQTLAASGVTEVIAINAGSATAVPDSANNATFIADTDFTGGNDDVTNHAITIPTAIASIAAPAAVYADAHQGGVTYTIPNLSAGNTYTVVLHFAELFFTTPNSRLFNVSINGTQVLTNFDIVAAAGNASFTAAVQTIPNITPLNGQIVIAFTNGAKDQPMVNGIEIQTGGPAIPSAPTALQVATGSSSAINLSWTASVSSGVTYTVFRSTTAGFVPSAATQVANNLTTTSFSDTSLTPSTMYYYVVEAVNGAGVLSPPSQQVSTSTAAASADVIAINAGSSMVVGSFIGDTDFVGGNDDAPGHSITIPAAIANIAAPAAVYADAHQGGVTYTIPNLSATRTYTVVLHFAELFFTTANSRQFNASINGTQVLQNFDIFAAAGNANFTAVVQSFANITPVNGQIVIAFSNGAHDQPMVNGIEIK